ncbi:hypothetical protein AVEN_78531-1 [Araneus ventricosus]|uniref:Uncharacterized protein n=1 Tax=Araneus ventricosus TaxID=182803 RepID=A0A4Y2ELT2_ARAVE|nr:hypothetical protein AVEN_78531-1 [Araneus ventricosus]
MFLAIYKAPADEHNLNKCRYAAFPKSSTKIKGLSSILLTKGAAEQQTFSNVFLFYHLCTNGAPLEEEEEFELDKILDKHGEI